MATNLTDPRHLRLVEWLLAKSVGEQQPATQIELAAELQVDPRTLRDWRARDDVQSRWRELAIQVGGDAERIKQVMDALFAQAIDPASPKQVTAATLIAKMVDAIGPNKRQEKPEERGSLLGFPIEQLEQMLAERASAAAA